MPVWEGGGLNRVALDWLRAPALRLLPWRTMPKPKLLQSMRANLRIRQFSPRARAPVRLPVVLTPDEVRLVLAQMRGITPLVAVLLSGSGCASWRASRSA